MTDSLLSPPPLKARSAVPVFPRIDVLDKCHVELVSGCNLRCLGCPISTLLPKVKRMEPDAFRHYMDHVDVEVIGKFRLFNYGETLLHHDLTGIFRHIAQLKMKIHDIEISTNGQYANWDDLEEVFRMRLMHTFAVSCDGDGTPESFERLRPPGKWDKLIAFLERAAELRNKHCPEMRLMTRTVCVDPVEQERWRSVLEPRGWTPEFRDWLNLPEAKERFNTKEPESVSGVCRFLQRFNQLYIDWDGTFVPCCAHPGAGNFGSLKTHRFNELIFGAERFGMIDAMQRDRAGMNICGQCTL